MLVLPGNVTVGPCMLSPSWRPFLGPDGPCSPLQLSCYDQAKQLVLSTGYLSDNIFTHFLASFIAVSGRSGGVGPDLALELRTARMRPGFEELHEAGEPLVPLWSHLCGCRGLESLQLSPG
jgi:hypothetical protein